MCKLDFIYGGIFALNEGKGHEKTHKTFVLWVIAPQSGLEPETL
jgi:hypothetical protein